MDVIPAVDVLDGKVVRLIEPSGNVGTQYPNDVGSEWFGTIENLSAGLAQGKVRWSEKGLSRCSLLYVDGYFLCLGEYGTLRLFRANPKKFEQIASTVLSKQDSGSAGRPLKYPAWAAPILSHGLLYIRGRDRLFCLELIAQQEASEDESVK